MFEGEATRPVTIRAPRAIAVDDAVPDIAPPAVDDVPEELEEEAAPLPPPPVLTSTPQPAARPDPASERRFGRLRRRRPPGS
jgi:hypothetical protein